MAQGLLWTAKYVDVDGSVGELVPGMADASIAEVDQAAAWRAVDGEAARDLADSGFGNSRTLGVPVFHRHTKATGHSARHDPSSI